VSVAHPGDRALEALGKAIGTLGLGDAELGGFRRGSSLASLRLGRARPNNG
jgi:hypothetical protein